MEFNFTCWGDIMKIGILGGTFDPIHNGHLIIGEYARVSANLDKVIFMPSGIHPFKDNKKVTDSKKRSRMIELAIKSNPYFRISTIEIERAGINYTIDSLRCLKEQYKDNEIYFIIGSDILFQIEKWKEFGNLIRLCKFILFYRIGKDEEKIVEKIQELKTKYNMNIDKIHSPIFPISSTEIRQRVEQGISIKYLVQENVEKYILENNIYKEETYE